MYYYYDENGSPIALSYDNSWPYYYYKNIFGDILGIMDSCGNVVVRYYYDAWGNIISTTGSMASTLGRDNPFRYRGYYYDTETGFYYLNARYYNPEWGRFISADPVLDTSSAAGCNMFAYCKNDPVNKVDPTGEFLIELFEFLEMTVSEIGKAMNTMAPAYAGCGGVAVLDGPLPFGDAIAIAGATIITAGVIGYGVYQATQSLSDSFEKTEEKAKAQDIAIPVKMDLPEDTVIYRHGGTNPGNLKPREKDVKIFKETGLGLSFSLVPKPGSAKTTIGDINSTGVLYAVHDYGTHVSVHPIGGTLEDWYNAGSLSIWTTALKSVVSKY